MSATWVAVNPRFPQVGFRRVFRPIKRSVPAGAEIVTAYTDGVVTLRSNRRREGYHEAHDMSGFQGVERGDFVVHGLDILRGSIGVSDSSGAITAVCTVCAPNLPVDARFFAYVMRAQAFSGLPKAMARGVREGGADFRRWDTLGELPVPLPKVSEQRAIADLLDVETVRIDALVAKKHRVMELVHLRYRAEVDEWTGHGNAVRVRRVAEAITSGPRGWSEQVGEVGSAFIRSANLRRDEIVLRSDNLMRVDVPLTTEAARSQVRQGDTLVGITGANTGWVGLVDGRHAGGFISQHVARIRPRGVVPEWLAFSVFAQRSQEQLLGGQYGGTKQQLGLEDLAELTIRVPSMEEQGELVHSLQRAARLKTELVEKLERQIGLLKERRQALITAAVTGEMKVPGVSQ